MVLRNIKDIPQNRTEKYLKKSVPVQFTEKLSLGHKNGNKKGELRFFSFAPKKNKEQIPEGALPPSGAEKKKLMPEYQDKEIYKLSDGQYWMP